MALLLPTSFRLLSLGQQQPNCDGNWCQPSTSDQVFYLSPRPAPRSAQSLWFIMITAAPYQVTGTTTEPPTRGSNHVVQIRLSENGADDYIHFAVGKNSSRSSADTSRTGNPQVDKSSALDSEHPAPAKHIIPFLKSFGNKESSKGFKCFEVTRDNINAC